MRIASFAVALASVATLTGCIVPELDNYPADKSKGSGTTVVGEDTVSTGGGDTGGTGSNCTPGTYYGSVVLDGTGASDAFNSECTVSGSVTVLPSATSAEIDKLQRIQWINGSLVLNVPPLAASLTLAYLQTVSGAISIENSGALQQLNLTGLVQTGSISIQNNATLVLLQAPAIANPIQSITVTGNTALQALDLTGYMVAGILNISNNSQLTRISMTSLSSVAQFFVNNNPLLQQMLVPAAGLSVTSQWSVCHNPNIEANWLAAFKAAHPAGGAICN